MTFKLKQAHPDDIQTAFDLLKLASKTLEAKKINQWKYWQDPPVEKIKWVKEGFLNKECYFIKNENNAVMGMVRILEEDLSYWGAMNDKSKYIHSLVIDKAFSGNNLGKQVILLIEENAKKNNFEYLRLDCDATNTKLCTYYENLGFILVGEKQLPLGIYNLYQKVIG
ncbi:GNAT family N-acetyltransferase [Aureibaculum sp. A20]|uniref:GNAT family N-acetyltransferase n=1 Tax=Aureibaculum flavum TaxID=2795986 RepID=A0ABS0WNC5_9FLAO|nr:GNAT family N-acetyltransferase [Aureibaculum flavum]MBJ2173456.1 GNAT family N-acetyltransferase [Aureibaculum flavum]